MREISRRLRRLEQQSALLETEGARRQREWIAELAQRGAEWRARRGYPPDPAEENQDLSGLTVTDVLNKGRDLARKRSLARAAKTLEPSSSGA